MVAFECDPGTVIDADLDGADPRGVDGNVEGPVVRVVPVDSITLSWITAHHPHMMPGIAADSTERTSRRALR